MTEPTPASNDEQWQRLLRHGFPVDTERDQLLFAAGDARRGSVKRVAAAVGEGSSVVASAHRAIARTPAPDRSVEASRR